MTKSELALRLRKISDALHEVADEMQKGQPRHSAELRSMAALTAIYGNQLETSIRMLPDGGCEIA